MPITSTDDPTTPELIPAAFRSTTPDSVRRHVQDAGDCLPAEQRQLLLGAAAEAELEGSESAFVGLVDQKEALRRALAHGQSNIRAALASRARS
ncbi:hypothetical protein [Burkholderia contaminans]|uniref:hypothetical protein n=1 Tax=Burkholderia contaminans TaxID=488447 RepID=UPI001FC8127D|nr:hypothetical protein [Burkholderia contaminans]